MIERSRSDYIKVGAATIIILCLFSASAAFELTQIQWISGTSGTLKRDDVMSYMGHSVKVTSLNAPVESDRYNNKPIEPVIPYVGLDISKNGTLINKTILGRGDSYISPDGEIKVMAVDFPASSGTEWLYESYNPWVKLELSQRGKPVFDLSIDSDNEFISGPNTEIPAKIIVKNIGTADILNVDLEVGSELPLLNGDLKFHYDKIQKGGQVSETITFATPILAELKKFDINMNVSGFDIKEIPYNKITSNSIFIVPPPMLLPTLSKSSNPKIYLKDYNLVSLSIKNNLNVDLKNVSITDTLPKGFKLISNNSLKWLVDIPANGEWSSRYVLKPFEADKNGIVFPATKAEFMIKNEYYMVQSNKPVTIVYGPNIVLKKQTTIQKITPGDTVTVKISALNKGSTPTKVSIIDTIPADVTLLSGNTTLEEYLEADKEVNFSYTIRSDTSGPFTLPAATADYFELGDRGAITSTRSQEISIRIKPPPTPVPTPGPAPDPTIEPEIAALLTPQSDPSGIPTAQVTESPQEIIIQETPDPSINGNVILRVILGCDNISNTENYDMIDICNLLNSTT
ncbi:MAG: hypothetical protein OIN87_08085 [Candidatus Methanoperedens sp.]|nr:hypothetical protein [Candidatus Methanoperedens sp.]